jgi:hypothetical protein
MNPREALNKTLESFDLKAIDIANATGLAESYISRYRSGKAGNIGSETLVRMIRTFPIEAQYYFWSLCMKPDTEKTTKGKNLAIATEKLETGF